ncbi:hypothetical protein [Kordia sp.]|uniref:hypothetical protein n=1 Tax=Kordia sp. TaxID=1965332 RepID=UPI003B596484
MNNKAHCGICDHKIYDFDIGAICGITNEAPNFSGKCNSIKPEQQLEAKIVDVHTKLKLVTKTKKDTIGHFILYSLINIAIVTLYYFIFTHEVQTGGKKGVLVIAFLSICLFGIAVGPINTYVIDYKIAKKAKEELDALLKIYKLDYEISIEISNEAHGDYDVEKKVKIFRIG